MYISKLKRWGLFVPLCLLLMGCNTDEAANNIVTPTAVPPTAEPVEEATDEPVAPTEVPVEPTEAVSEEPTEEVVEELADEEEPAAEEVVEENGDDLFPSPLEPDYDVQLTENLCPFEIPITSEGVTCGIVEVPADRGALDNGRMIELPVAIFRSTDADPGIPVIYLDGGPGGSSLETLRFSYEDNIEPFLADRDYIVFDQRGTGYSEPSLACPETRELELELLDDPRDEEVQTEQYLEALQACHDRLVGDDIDLSVYNSREGAADVNDIRRALGYDVLHLNGISYGTRLGLTLMRDYPEMVASAVLDSPVPLQSDLNVDLPTSVAGAYDAFFAGCAADAECAAAYPALEADFYALVDQLNADPINFMVPDVFSGEEYEVLFDGESLKGTLFQTLYSNQMFPSMSKIIDQLQEGNTSELRWIEANALVSGLFLSEGVYHSVRCVEEVPFYDREALLEAAVSEPDVADLFSDSDVVLDVCDLWAVEPSPALENEAVSSDIPTLLLAGEYDPVTPFAFGRQTAESLSNVYYFEVPHVGHGVHVSDVCPMEMVLAFLREPTAEPDSSCIAEMEAPDFGVEGVVDTAVTLEPFTGEMEGVTINAVRPLEWEAFGETVFARGQSAADQTTIVFQAYQSIMISPDEVIIFFTSQLSLTDVPESPEEYTDGNGRVWSLYRVTSSGLPTDIAVFGDDDFVYVVLLIMQEEEGDLWRDSLLYPALEGMRAES